MIDSVFALVPICIVFLISIMAMRAVFGQQVRWHGYSYADVIASGGSAASIRLAGLLLGGTIGFWGVITPTELGPLHDLVKITQSLLFVMTFVIIAGYVNDKVMFHQVDNLREVFVNNNTAVAVLEFASFVATGLIFNGTQSSGEYVLAGVVWFIIGQLLMVTSVYLYAFLHGGIKVMNDEAKNGNLAYAFSCTGFIISVGVVIRSIANSVARIELIVATFLAWVVVAFILQYVVNHLIVPKKSANTPKSYGVGVLQGSTFLLSALVTSVLS